MWNYTIKIVLLQRGDNVYERGNHYNGTYIWYVQPVFFPNNICNFVHYKPNILWTYGLIFVYWFNNIYSFNQQGKPYIKVSGWQCDYNGVHMCT